MVRDIELRTLLSKNIYFRKSPYVNAFLVGTDNQSPR